MPQDRLRKQVELVLIRTTNRAQMVIVAAVAEKIRNRFLQHDRRAEGVGELQPAHALEIPSGSTPADAQRGRERLAERTAQQDAPIGIPCLERLRAAFAVVQVAVNV